ncbi:alkaline ceramidase 3-like [Amphiura filiformis]|uniref:alkaline ceramidase 3-like n=1 Tax=Amphiura filiformis TaxID=82378 RepID=UPI003B211509
MRIMQNMNLDKAKDASGMWSPLTAHNDWCEENYDTTFYVAEFWNTITNITFIINALIGLRQTYKDRSERRNFNIYLTLLAVGIGSWLFHMTLRHTLQMADEIPMLWLAAVGIYSIWEVNASPRKLNVAVFMSLLIATTGASIATLLFAKVIYFQVSRMNAVVFELELM